MKNLRPLLDGVDCSEKSSTNRIESWQRTGEREYIKLVRMAKLEFVKLD